MEQKPHSVDSQSSIPVHEKLAAGYYLARFRGNEKEAADPVARPYRVSVSRSDNSGEDVLRRALLEHDGTLHGRWYEFRQNFEVVRPMDEDEVIDWLRAEDAQTQHQQEISSLQQLLAKHMPDLVSTAQARYPGLYGQ